MYKFSRLKNSIVLILTGIIFIGLSEEVWAASKLLLETSSQGMAKASLTIEPQDSQTGKVQTTGSLIKILLIPFELSSTHTISSPDNVKISTLSSNNGYTLLAILAPRWNEPINFQINNALSLVDDKTQARTKFQFDFSYKYMTIHRNILNRPETISSYDIVVSLPQKYRKDELSFEPRKDWKEIIEGQKYIFPASKSGSQNPSISEIWVAFPSIYKKEFNFIYLVLSSIAGIILSLITSKTLINPSQESHILGFLVLLAIVYFILLILNLFKVRPLELLVIICGPTVTVLYILFGSSWLLMSRQYQAEVSGKVKKSSGDPANYYTVSLFINEKKTNKRVFLETEREGKYKFQIWCGKERKKCKVQVLDLNLQTVSSSEVVELSAKDKIEFDDITITLPSI